MHIEFVYAVNEIASFRGAESLMNVTCNKMNNLYEPRDTFFSIYPNTISYSPYNNKFNKCTTFLITGYYVNTECCT